MFVTGPNVVKTVTHEEVTAEELGAVRKHPREQERCGPLDGAQRGGGDRPASRSC